MLPLKTFEDRVVPGHAFVERVMPRQELVDAPHASLRLAGRHYPAVGHPEDGSIDVP